MKIVWNHETNFNKKRAEEEMVIYTYNTRKVSIPTGTETWQLLALKIQLCIISGAAVPTET